MSDKSFLNTRLYWRHSFVQPKMGPMDYRAIFLILPFVFYVRISSLIFLLFLLTVMWVLQKRKIEPDNLLRWIRSAIAGPERTAHGARRLRQPVDFGFETQEMVDSELRRQANIRENRKSKKYKGRRYPDPKTLGENKLLPLEQRFTTTRSA